MKKVKPSIKKKRNSGNGSLFRPFLLYFFLSHMIIIIASYLAIKELSKKLPDHKQLETKIVNQQLSTFIYSHDGVMLKTLGEKKSYWASYDQISPYMIDALIAAEDKRFFNHWGVSVRDIARASLVNLKASRFRLTKKFPYIFDYKIKEGGSTITQQLARDIFLDRNQTFKRKLKEQIVALKIEQTYSKTEILEFFLNRMEFGWPFIGIQAAARGYFGKDCSELNIGESAMLAGMLQNSYLNNPRLGEKSLARATARRNTVLRMMVQAGKISYAQAHNEIAEPIKLGASTLTDYGKAPYFVDYVEDELFTRFGQERVDNEGLKVWTTLDYRLQQIAEDSLEQQLDYIQKNYADKIRYHRPNGLTDAEAEQDSLSKTQVQGALVALDVKTGEILVMVGGRKYDYFNRATQAERHAGSSFKPFVYTAALDNGWRCCDVIVDSPYQALNPDRITYWQPQNFEKNYMGPLSLRDALKISRNIISIKLMNDRENRGIGPETVIKYAREMGITTRLNSVPSLAIGTSPVKLIEMVSAYTIFPNLGIKTNTFAIDEVRNKNNVTIYRQSNSEGAKREVLSPATASLMLTMLETVTREGTASGVIRRMNMSDRPCAGKTGTGNDYKDAWFIGVTPYLACGVWIGFDSEETTLGGNMYGTGAIAALPVWVDFISKSSELYGLPKDRFSYSSEITTLPICRNSYLRSTSSCPDSSIYIEYFLPGTEITEFCSVHRPKTRTGRF
ncbi:MAG: PBP1A family penicillin-binding protein [Candidatus Latescibacteria bacterium]|nr:PBP1A family penicillin-binding protein [Candidatus Latescibacterota bacterium]